MSHAVSIITIIIIRGSAAVAVCTSIAPLLYYTTITYREDDNTFTRFSRFANTVRIIIPRCFSLIFSFTFPDHLLPVIKRNISTSLHVCRLSGRRRRISVFGALLAVVVVPVFTFKRTYIIILFSSRQRNQCDGPSVNLSTDWVRIPILKD